MSKKSYLYSIPRGLLILFFLKISFTQTYFLGEVNVDSTITIHLSDRRFYNNINFPDRYGEPIPNFSTKLEHFIVQKNLGDPENFKFEEINPNKYKLNMKVKNTDGYNLDFPLIDSFSELNPHKKIYSAYKPVSNGMSPVLTFMIKEIYFTKYPNDLERYYAVTERVVLPPEINVKDRLLCIKGVSKTENNNHISQTIPDLVMNVIDSLKTIFLRGLDISNPFLENIEVDIQPYDINVYKIYDKKRYLISMWYGDPPARMEVFCLNDRGDIKLPPKNYEENPAILFRTVRFPSRYGPRDYFIGVKPMTGYSVYMIGAKGRLHEIIFMSTIDGC